MRRDRSGRPFAWKILLAVSWLLAGCSNLPSKKEQFDPRAVLPERTPADFFNIEMDRLDPSYLKPSRELAQIGRGDTLQIEVLEHPETLSEVLVMPDGMIYYDLAEGVYASGITAAELEKKLENKLQEHYNAPVVSVSFRGHDSRSFTIYGAVPSAGTYSLNRPTPLLEALSAAGGAAGDLDRSIVIRKEKVLPVNFRKLVENGDTSQNIYLAAGDLIFIPEPSASVVYMLGNVNRAGPVSWSPNLHIVPAIAEAGGLSGGAHAQKVALIRGSLSNPEVAVIPLEDILKGKVPSFPLQPGDIIWVPKSPWKIIGAEAKSFVYAAATTIAVRAADEVVGGDLNDRNNRSSVSIPVESVPAPAPIPPRVP